MKQVFSEKIGAVSFEAAPMVKVSFA